MKFFKNEAMLVTYDSHQKFLDLRFTVFYMVKRASQTKISKTEVKKVETSKLPIQAM